MTVAAPSLTDQAAISRNRLILVVYTLAIFVSALLLFSVQPLFTKMVLPRLGGSPGCGRWRWCFSSRCCSPAMPMRIT